MSAVNVAENYAVNIIQELWRQRETEEFCDAVLIAGAENTRIAVHSCVLSAASNYFKQKFTPLTWSVNKAIEVEMSNVDCEILQILVQYCYTGLVSNSHDRVVELLKTAEVLHLRSVVTACANLLAEKLHPSNCLDFVSLAEQYQCKMLLQKAKDYSMEHFMAVRETKEFLNLNAKQLRVMLASDNLAVSSEEDVFNGLKAWIEHKFTERKKYQKQLLKLVRLPLLKKSFLVKFVKPICTSTECLRIYKSAIKQHSAPQYLKPKQRISTLKLRQPNELLLGITLSKHKLHIHYHCAHQLKWLKWSKVLNYRRWHGLAVMENNLFLIGGQQADRESLNTVVCLNLRAMNLTEISPMSTRRAWCGAAVLNGFLYAVGGNNGNDALKSAEKWYPKTNTWRKVASMAVRRDSFGAVVLNDKLYAIGGLSSADVAVNTAEFYDPQQNVWMPIASMHQARHLFGVTVANGLIYAVGGCESGKSAERYNPVTNSWTLLCSLRDSLCDFDTCTTLRGKVIVCHTDRIEEYADGTDEWKISAALGALSNHDRIFTYSGELLKSEFIEN